MDSTRLVAGDLSEAVRACQAALEDGWTTSAEAARVGRILERFVGFAVTGMGVTALGAVTPEIAASFVRAPRTDGTPATLPLLHLRRTALRLLFRTARQAGLHVGDPTLDLVLPPRSPLSARPLSDDEVALCRSHALWSLSDSRRAAAWALAEATCRSYELAFITVGDLDLVDDRVWIHGGRTTTDRWGGLTDWGTTQVRRRVQELGADPHRRLVYSGRSSGESGRVSPSLAIIDVLTRAGLAAEPDVRPSSVAAWAGRRILNETGCIDEVARRLGISSLDRTARFIAWDWSAVEPEAE